MDLSICLKALGDPTRLMIFQQLLIRKHCTRSLSMKLGFSEPTISQHLKILWEAGLVYKEKYGYHMHYLPKQEAVDFLADAFGQISQASLNLDRNPGVCQCEFRQQTEIKVIEKEQNVMRIAVTYDNGEIFQHFGHTEQFKLYDVQNGKIVNEQVVDTNGSGHGALAGFLQAVHADALICSGIGMGAQMALTEAGVKLYAGVQGSADEAARALSEGHLEYDPDARCDHHEHHGGDCGHEHCADHQCAGN